MKNTTFGKIAQFNVGRPLDGDVELMVFEQEGSDHTHDRHEVAFCVAGEGQVVMEDAAIEVQQGESVTIPPGMEHRMVPKLQNSDPFVFMIAYY